MTTFFDIRDEFNKNGEVLVATDIENGNKFILNEDINSPQITDYKGKKCFIEKLMDKTKIVVAGAGHVSMDFARVAEILGFDLIIIDDRAEFANSERFPNAQIICGNIGESLKADFGKNVYYVIMTRGHKDDYEALKTILGKEYKYVGMIGSRKKVAFVKDKLKNDGFTDEKINTAHTPIGLDIGAITPAEIAISIMAEIIQVQNKGIKDRGDGDLLNKINHNCAMVTVIEKAGSAPRGEGSKMLVFDNGKVLGTIGGGTLEYVAINKAIEIAKNGGFFVKEYSLENNKASELGMACGGSVKVMIEGLD